MYPYILRHTYMRLLLLLHTMMLLSLLSSCCAFKESVPPRVENAYVMEDGEEGGQGRFLCSAFFSLKN